MFEKIKKWWNDMNKKQPLEQLIGLDCGIGEDMLQAIYLWNDIFKGNAPWNNKDPSCGIVDCISGILSSTIGEELLVSSDNAELSGIVNFLNENSYKIVEQTAVIGGTLLRPIFEDDTVAVEILPLGNYIPLKYNSKGLLVKCNIFKPITIKKDRYVLKEQHSYIKKTHTIETKLFKITGTVHKEVSLSTLDATADISPLVIWENVDFPFIVEVRNRKINKVDGSNVPVSLISGLEHLIKQADEQWGRMVWEQKAGKLKLHVHEDLLLKDENGKVRVDDEIKDLFVKFDSGSEDGSMWAVFNPGFRTAEQDLFLQQILRRIEVSSGIGKGSLSDMQDIKMTATQYTGGKKMFFSTIDTMENEIAQKYKQVAKVITYMLNAINGTNDTDEITVTYNDITRQDVMTIKQVDMQEVGLGLLSEWEYRVKHYGEDEATAKANASTSTDDITPPLD